MHDFDRLARFFGLGILRDGEEARQAGERVAAERIVDQLSKNYLGIIRREADGQQRPLTNIGRLCHAKPDRAGRRFVEQTCGHTGRSPSTVTRKPERVSGK